MQREELTEQIGKLNIKIAKANKELDELELKYKKKKVRNKELDGQVEIILRALELYGYNLDYMLNSNDSSDDTRQEKKSLLY